jgi:hypothetical protein
VCAIAVFDTITVLRLSFDTIDYQIAVFDTIPVTALRLSFDTIDYQITVFDTITVVRLTSAWISDTGTTLPQYKYLIDLMDL